MNICSYSALTHPQSQPNPPSWETPQFMKMFWWRRNTLNLDDKCGRNGGRNGGGPFFRNVVMDNNRTPPPLPNRETNCYLTQNLHQNPPGLIQCSSTVLTLCSWLWGLSFAATSPCHDFFTSSAHLYKVKQKNRKVHISLQCSNTELSHANVPRRLETN